MKTITLTTLLLCVALTSCGDPLKQKVSELTGGQRNELTQQLSPDDLKIFLSYMKRQTTVNASSQESRESVNILQAIAEERQWIAQEQQKLDGEKRKELEKIKIADEKKLKEAYNGKQVLDLINQAISYKLLEKNNVVGEYSQPYVSFTFSFENKTEKDITHISGVLSVKDDFDRKVKDFAFIYDELLEPHKTTEYKARLKINMRQVTDTELYSLNFDRIKPNILVNELHFKDKTILKMPAKE